MRIPRGEGRELGCSAKFGPACGSLRLCELASVCMCDYACDYVCDSASVCNSVYRYDSVHV